MEGTSNMSFYLDNKGLPVTNMNAPRPITGVSTTNMDVGTVSGQPRVPARVKQNKKTWRAALILAVVLLIVVVIVAGVTVYNTILLQRLMTGKSILFMIF